VIFIWFIIIAFATGQTSQPVSLRAADALPAAWQSPFGRKNVVEHEIATPKNGSQ
jgi:hypothetical protein